VRTRNLVVVAGLVCICWTAAVAQQTAVHELGIKYMRDSEEYATLARQVYRLAGDAVASAASSAPARRWAVVLDIDETTLDNSTYQLERSAMTGYRVSGSSVTLT
jgi:predicted secreted acid phosphatase